MRAVDGDRQRENPDVRYINYLHELYVARCVSRCLHADPGIMSALQVQHEQRI
jgi:hypothetical protein